MSWSSIRSALPSCALWIVLAQSALAQAPTPDFSGAPTTGDHPLAVTFTDLTTGSVTAWAWDFGDLGSSTLQNPTHTYTAAGTYTVSLTATGPGGSDVETKTDYITVTEPPPVSDFSGTPTTGVVPLSVSFTNLTSGAATGWLWFFGDGSTSTLQDPSYTYPSTGTYTVRLQATGPGGVDLEIKTDYITVTDPPPTADFSGTPLAGTPPLVVSFTDLSVGTVTSWAWDFGDTGSSTQQNPTHTYTQPGTYSVSLTATGPLGSGVETKTDYVVVQVPAASTFRNGVGTNPACFMARPPVLGAPWLAEVDSGVLDGATLSVIFGRLAPVNGIPTAFGELLIDTGSPILFDSIRVATGGVDPHVFPLPNDMSLIGRPGVTQAMVLGPLGTGQFCNASDLILGFQPQDTPPTAIFGTDVDSGPPALTVTFSDQSTGDVSSWSWDFGDGASSTQQNPTHTYAAIGTYTVTLVASGATGFDTEIAFDRIIVADPPVAEFTGTPQSGNAPLTAIFTDQTAGSVTAWSWTFGDGASSTLQNPTHVYTLPGTFTVGLTATGPGGSSIETKTDFIVAVALGSVAAFSATPLAGITPLTVDFTDLSAGTITTWSWDFGDGGTSTLRHPTHVYALPGTYTVELSVDGPGGLDVETKLDYIAVSPPPPVPDFSGTPLSGTQPLTVNFTDASTGDISSYSWSFGDGGSSTTQNPSHVYSLFGTYTVSLTATGPGGSVTETKSAYVTVLPPPPSADFTATPTVGPAPLFVQFDDQSVGLITAWSWDFGDGETSSLANPQHTYQDVGTYTVSLTTTGSGGSDVETKADYIVVQIPPLRDGSFELQTAGGAPLSPWVVSSGFGHLIYPGLGPASDNDFPTEGTQWAQVSATGTNAATPPSNPGGAGLAPVGAAGFAQLFSFEPDAPVLLFRAAFVLGGAAMDAGANDFMSVDITDGTTTYNLFYADTFDAFPDTSAVHGLPMTATSVVETNLGTLFPGAVTGTGLTLSVTCGNGGDGNDASLGYVDQFETFGLAAASYFNGSGTNPPCYVALPPVLGQTWSADVDHRDRPAANVVVILLRSMQIVPLPVSGFGEFLIGGTALLDFILPAHPSGITTQAFPVPSDPSLIGTAQSQALVLGPPDQTFCNGVQLTVGFAPAEAAPQAAFLAAPTTGPAPLDVTFTDQSTGTITSWDWDFGDGSSSTLASPMHTYANPGTYSVVLRVTGPGGFDIVRELDQIQVP